MSSGGRLSSWRRYVALRRAAGDKPEAALAVFRARYRMARGFQEATFTDMTPATQRSYNSLLRLGLSYAALDALCAALGRTTAREPVLAKEIADRLRDKRSDHLADVMRAGAEPRLARRIGHLLDTPTEYDVMPAAAFLRHTFFHGVLTATRSGAAREWERRIVDDLAARLLATADEQFTAHVARSTPR